jgi:hypothetical protein
MIYVRGADHVHHDAKDMDFARIEASGDIRRNRLSEQLIRKDSDT